MRENEALPNLSDDDLAEVAGGAAVPDVAQMLREAGDQMRQANREARQADRDAAVAGSVAEAERMRQSATDNLVMGMLSGAANVGPSAFHDAVNGLKQNGMWERISPSLRQTLEGRL